MYKRKIVLEHRKIMEEFIKRPLKKEELVHHIDGDPWNNNINNLKIVSKEEHLQLHKKEPNMIELICNNCNQKFKRFVREHKYKTKMGYKNKYCSRKCCIAGTEKYLTGSKYKGTSKFAKIIEKGLKQGLTPYAIAKQSGKFTKGTVYLYLKNKKK
jgi:hypothetical protein